MYIKSYEEYEEYEFFLMTQLIFNLEIRLLPLIGFPTYYYIFVKNMKTILHIIHLFHKYKLRCR